MKPVFLLIFLLIIKVSFSQSKKEQIEMLTNRVDSLNQVVNSQIKIINDKNLQISGLNTKIANLESSISSLNADISNLNLERQGNKNEIATKSQELSNLQAQLKTKTDSLSLVLSELEKLKPTLKTNVLTISTNQVTKTGSFKSVKIGTQIWMAENLNVLTFRNGDSIPEAKTNEEWVKAGNESKPAWCYYANDAKNGAKYGKLYNWYAVIDPRGLAPSGWHIPNDDEWTTLENFMGDEAGKKMKSTNGWNNWEEYITCSNCKVASAEYKKICSVCKGTSKNGKKTNSGNGTNSSKFCGLPSGVRDYVGTFYDIGYSSTWWTSKVNATDRAWYRSLENDGANVTRFHVSKVNGFSVRCLKD
jgi:uncharacterized protein (TIGR02145 family)